jgi:hypothetical protein
MSAEEKPGFTVTDRRSFATGADGSEAKAATPPEPAKSEEKNQKSEQPTSAAAEGRPLPPVDFTTFVLSLGQSAVLHLGEAEHPGSGKVEKDLPMAKHTIDLLSMLQDKTKGNLTAHEEKLLESVLYDLRLRYVEAARR